jgi:hypothetical protein
MDQFANPDMSKRARNPRLMFYNLKTVVDMVPLNDYDVILYARVDMVCTDDIDLSVAKGLDNVVFIPSGYDWGGTNDQMAFGTPSAMFTYSRLYDSFADCIFREGSPGGVDTDVNSNVNPEKTLSTHLENVPLDVRRFELQYHLHPKRCDRE